MNIIVNGLPGGRPLRASGLVAGAHACATQAGGGQGFGRAAGAHRGKAAGVPVVGLKLGNATGTLGVNVWKEHVRLIEGVRPGQVVQVIGTVELYKGARQLKLTAPPRVVASGGDPNDYSGLEAVGVGRGPLSRKPPQSGTLP